MRRVHHKCYFSLFYSLSVIFHWNDSCVGWILLGWWNKSGGLTYEIIPRALDQTVYSIGQWDYLRTSQPTGDRWLITLSVCLSYGVRHSKDVDEHESRFVRRPLLVWDHDLATSRERLPMINQPVAGRRATPFVLILFWRYLCHERGMPKTYSTDITWDECHLGTFRHLFREITRFKIWDI